MPSLSSSDFGPWTGHQIINVSMWFYYSMNNELTPRLVGRGLGALHMYGTRSPVYTVLDIGICFESLDLGKTTPNISTIYAQGMDNRNRYLERHRDLLTYYGVLRGTTYVT